MISVLREYFAFGRAYQPKLIRGLVFTFLHALFEALQITALWVVFTDLAHGTVSGSTALVALAIMLASIAGSFITAHLSSMNFCFANYGNAGRKRAEVGDRLRHLPMGYLNEKSLGEVTGVMTNTLDDVQNLGGMVYQAVLGGLAFSLMICAMMFVLDWRLGLLTLVTIALFAGSMELLQRFVRATSDKRVAAQARIVGAVLEYVRGIGVVRAFSLLDSAQDRLSGAIADCERQNVAFELAAMRFAVMQAFVSKASSVAMCLLSCWLLVSGSMDAGISLTMIVASFMVFSRLEMSGAFSTILRQIEVAMGRVDAMLAVKGMDEGAGLEEAPGLDITVENVSFGYGSGRVLEDVSLTVPAGTSCAIVGPSGSGKTTLVRLIERFWDVDGGRIALGGRDVRDYRVDALLANFSTVFQGVFLFDDTIENNIKFGTPAATHEQVVAAARRACCDEFISSLPDGYDTRLGENGATLSGGERQRLSIARAILKDAPIVVLDEATANVDPENELDLQRAIAELTQSKTVIMIAHRLKTVRDADQILVMDAGRIVQRGTHGELMEQGGLYADFVNMRERAAGWKIAVA